MSLSVTLRPYWPKPLPKPKPAIKLFWYKKFKEVAPSIEIPTLSVAVVFLEKYPKLIFCKVELFWTVKIVSNDPEFIDHRHDQSLFSLLRKKYGTILIPDETWYPDFRNPQVLNYPILATRIRI